jgi:hypothetical protein
MGEFDVPRGIFAGSFVGEVCGSVTGFDGDVDVVSEGCDDVEHGFRIVGDGLVGEDFFLWVEDADLEGMGMVVNADENW